MAGHLSHRDRVAATITVVGATALAAGLALVVRGRTGPLHVDSVGLRYLGQSVGPRPLGHRVLIWFGTPLAITITTLALVALALRWRDRVGAVLAVAGPLLAGVITDVVLKPLVNRTGPGGQNYFPSGHVTAVSSFTVVALFLLDRRHGRRAALTALPVLAAWVGAVALAMVQVHAHYVTDVVGGACIGVASVLVLVLAVERRAGRTEATP